MFFPSAPHYEDDRTRADRGTSPKPYLSIEELAGLTPWTTQAIRSMIKRGILVMDIHFFRIGRRLVFKWAAIVDFIEGRVIPTPVPTLRRGEGV